LPGERQRCCGEFVWGGEILQTRSRSESCRWSIQLWVLLCVQDWSDDRVVWDSQLLRRSTDQNDVFSQFYCVYGCTHGKGAASTDRRSPTFTGSPQTKGIAMRNSDTQSVFKHGAVSLLVSSNQQSTSSFPPLQTESAGNGTIGTIWSATCPC
jgi:hypothetical protein